MLYGDRTSIFVRHDRSWTLQEELAGGTIAHLGRRRILRALGIGYIPARSPQAKGRIERFWGTLQDRLVSVLRLRGVSSLEQTQDFLADFIQDYNQRFTRAPRDPKPAWRSAPRDLDTHLACHYTRIVANDNTVSLPDRWIQIPRGPRHRSYAGRQVTIAERLDGSLLVLYQGAPDRTTGTPKGILYTSLSPREPLHSLRASPAPQGQAYLATSAPPSRFPRFGPNTPGGAPIPPTPLPRRTGTKSPSSEGGHFYCSTTGKPGR